MKLHTLVQLLFYVLCHWNWMLQCVICAEHSYHYQELDNATIYDPYLDVILSPDESQELQYRINNDAQLPESPPLSDTLVTIDNQSLTPLSPQTRAQTETADNKINICTIGKLPVELTGVIIQFLKINETKQCLEINHKWRYAVTHQRQCLQSEAIIEQQITRPRVKRVYGSCNLMLNFPDDCMSRVLLTTAFVSAKKRSLQQSLFLDKKSDSDIDDDRKIMNKNLKLFWLVGQYRHNNNSCRSQFIINDTQSITDLNDKYIADLEHLIFEIVDNTISSIKFRFNTMRDKWCMFADLTTVLTIFEASLQLRFVVIQLLLDKNESDINWQRVDNMTLNLNQKIVSYRWLVKRIQHHTPENITDMFIDEYQKFHARTKQWLDLSTDINRKITNKNDEIKERRSRTQSRIILYVLIAIIIMVVIVSLLAKFAYA